MHSYLNLYFINRVSGRLMRLPAFILLYLAFACVPRPLSRPQPQSALSLALSPAEQRLADSLLTLALDHEALYTLAPGSTLKPMSTVATFYFPIAKDTTHRDGDRNIVDAQHPALTQIRQLERIAAALETEHLGFILNPFRLTQPGQRAMQLSVYRKDLLRELISREQSFFGQWGFVPETPPAILVNTVEFEAKNDRYRGYGYLFGYPEHAVHFFVQASIESDSTGNFVSRQFFQIPVYSGKEGHFTYALPKDVPATVADSSMYHQASTVLGQYRQRREQYVTDSLLRARALLYDWYREEVR